MASTLQTLLRKSQAARLIAALRSQPAPNLTASFVLHQPHLVETKQNGHGASNLSLSRGSPETENLTPTPFAHIYPSFQFGFCLNPIFSTGLVPSEAEDMGLDDSRTVWADSVKKKRKKKMNKHKYNKLRKRLRRQT